MLWLAPAASAATGYTALSVQLSTDDIHWSSGIQVTPGSRVSVRIVGAYEGRAAMHGLAWVNFQPVISNWYGTDDRVLPFVASGNQRDGQALTVTLLRPPDGEILKAVPGVRSAELLAPGRFRLVHEPGVSPAEALVRRCVVDDWGLVALVPEETTLEEVFVQLTQRDEAEAPVAETQP